MTIQNTDLFLVQRGDESFNVDFERVKDSLGPSDLPTFTRESWTASEGQTVFICTEKFTDGQEMVYLNGSHLARTIDYTTGFNDRITLIKPANEGDFLELTCGNYIQTNPSGEPGDDRFVKLTSDTTQVIDSEIEIAGDLDVSGNVGIGTDSPSRKLHVNSEGTVQTALFESTNTSSYLTFMDSGTTDSTSVRIGCSGDEMRLFTGGSDSVRIDEDGKVGIGTNSPQTNLEILSSTPELRVNNSDGGLRRMSFAGSGSNIWYLNSNGTDDSNSFEIIQGSNTRLFLKSGGNVGIGTDNPQATLEVSSSGNSATDVELSRTRITGGTNNPMFRVFANETNNLITLATNGSNSNSEIQINTTSTEAVRIDKDGKVGIGTTDPQATLDVNNEVLVKSVGSGGAKRSTLQMLGTSSYPTNASALLIKEGNTSNASISYDGNAYFAGNVGIGTDDPQATLDVNGIGLFGTDPDNGAGSGIRLNNSGLILAGRETTKNIFAGFLDGSTGTTSRITADGDAVFNGTVTATNVPASDARFKENITPAKPQLADVVALGGLLKNYDWNDQAPLNEALRSVRQLGLIAQEVEEVCPSITKEIHRTKQGAMLTPEEVIPAVYEDKVIPAEYKTIVVPAKLGPKGKEIVPASTEEVLVTPEYTERVLITEEQVIPATYEELDDSYKGISQDAMIMKLIGAVAELSAELKALQEVLTKNEELEQRIAALEGT